MRWDIRPVANYKLGFEEAELKKCLASRNRAPRLQATASVATPSSNNYFRIDRADPALECGTFIASLGLSSDQRSDSTRVVLLIGSRDR
jgi:hypothetical protein